MELEKLTQKMSVGNLRSWAQVLILSAILSVTFFLLLLDAGKVYRSDVTVLVVPKSQTAAISEEKILGNLTQLPRLLAFYDKLLRDNPDVRDVAAGHSQKDRQEIWNDMVSVRRLGGNDSLIRISATAKLQTDADQLAKKTARTLFDTAAAYYNVQNDLDLRVVDGPVSAPHVSSWPWSLLLSLVLAVAVAVLFRHLFRAGAQSMFKKRDLSALSLLRNLKKPSSGQPEGEIRSLDELYEAERSEAAYVEPEFPTEENWEEEYIPQIPEEETVADRIAPQTGSPELDALEKMARQEMYPNFPEMPIHKSVQASAPSNLPIADDTFSMDRIHEPQTKEKATGEPTEEELKKRLNQLLRGEL